MVDERQSKKRKAPDSSQLPKKPPKKKVKTTEGDEQFIAPQDNPDPRFFFAY